MPGKIVLSLMKSGVKKYAMKTPLNRAATKLKITVSNNETIN